MKIHINLIVLTISHFIKNWFHNCNNVYITIFLFSNSNVRDCKSYAFVDDRNRHNQIYHPISDFPVPGTFSLNCYVFKAFNYWYYGAPGSMISFWPHEAVKANMCLNLNLILMDNILPNMELFGFAIFPYDFCWILYL